MKPRVVLEPAARLLVESGAVRGVQVVRVSAGAGDRWAVIFAVGLSEMTLASKREDVRLFAKIDTVCDFLRNIGIKDFSVRG